MSNTYTISNSQTNTKLFQFKEKISDHSSQIPILLILSLSPLANTDKPISNLPKNIIVSKVNHKANIKNYDFAKKDDIIFNIAIPKKEEESQMSDVTQKDLNRTERYFHEQLDKHSSKLEEKLDSVSSEISEIKNSLTTINNEISNLPDKLKASKWDYFIKSIGVPLLVGIITAVITAYVTLKFGTSK